MADVARRGTDRRGVQRRPLCVQLDMRHQANPHARRRDGVVSGFKTEMRRPPQAHIVVQRPTDVVDEPAWHPCSYCWGQRTIFLPVRSPRGQLKGYLQIACPSCLGIGDVCDDPMSAP
jgi:hypothetical protein